MKITISLNIVQLVLLHHLLYFLYSNTSTINIEWFERVLHRTQRYCFYYSLQSLGVRLPGVFFSISNILKWKIWSVVMRTREVDVRRQIYLRKIKFNFVSIGTCFHCLLKCFFWEFQRLKMNLFWCDWSNLYECLRDWIWWLANVNIKIDNRKMIRHIILHFKIN